MLKGFKKLFKIQTYKKTALKEQLWNTAIGFIVAYIVVQALGPIIFKTDISHSQNLSWTVVMTVVSIIRGYFVRLWFSRKHYIKALRTEVNLLRKETRLSLKTIKKVKQGIKEAKKGNLKKLDWEPIKDESWLRSSSELDETFTGIGLINTNHPVKKTKKGKKK